MVTNNNNNQKYSNAADGFVLGGGATERDLTVTGANITLTGAGTNTYTFPSATDTLVGRASTDTLTNKTLTDPILPLNSVVTAQTDATNQTGFANITGLSASLTSGKTYIMCSYLPLSASAAGGIKFTLASTDALSLTSCSVNGKTYNGASLIANSTTTSTTLNAAPVGAITGAATDAYISAAMVVNASGTLVLRMAQNTANSATSSVLVNGYMWVQRIN